VKSAPFDQSYPTIIYLFCDFDLIERNDISFSHLFIDYLCHLITPSLSLSQKKPTQKNKKHKKNQNIKTKQKTNSQTKNN